MARSSAKGLLRCVLAAACMAVPRVYAQSVAEAPGSPPHDRLIDMPCARALPAAGVAAGLRMFPEGGLLASVSVGVTDRFGLGASFGGANLIGMGRARFNPQPAVQIAYLVLPERLLAPALLVGFDSQGFLAYDRARKRYPVKSRGIYAVLSKNTSFVGGLGLHLGVNRSLETGDGDSDADVFAGCHKWVGPEWLFLAEYDAALNDGPDGNPLSGKGLLNLAGRWFFAPNVFFEAAWKNVLENGTLANRNAREVKIVYLSFF